MWANGIDYSSLLANTQHQSRAIFEGAINCELVINGALTQDSPPSFKNVMWYELFAEVEVENSLATLLWAAHPLEILSHLSWVVLAYALVAKYVGASLAAKGVVDGRGLVGGLLDSPEKVPLFMGSSSS